MSSFSKKTIKKDKFWGKFNKFSIHILTNDQNLDRQNATSDEMDRLQMDFDVNNNAVVPASKPLSLSKLLRNNLRSK